MRGDDQRQKWVSGVIAGTIATVVMTVPLLLAPYFAGTQPQLLHAAEALSHGALLLAVAAHMLYGAAAGALYMRYARCISLTSGAFYGFALWGLAAAVYAPLSGLGFLASHAHGLAVLVLPAHLIYGGTLGALAPRGEITQTIEDGLESIEPMAAEA